MTRETFFTKDIFQLHLSKQACNTCLTRLMVQYQWAPLIYSYWHHSLKVWSIWFTKSTTRSKSSPSFSIHYHRCDLYSLFFSVISFTSVSFISSERIRGDVQLKPFIGVLHPWNQRIITLPTSIAAVLLFVQENVHFACKTPVHCSKAHCCSHSAGCQTATYSKKFTKIFGMT